MVVIVWVCSLASPVLKYIIEAGIGFAFILSIMYMVAGAYCSKRMVVKKA